MDRSLPTTRALWFAGVAGLGAIAVRVWDLLLLKRTVHEPFVLLAWLAAAWLLVAVVLAAERRAGSGLPQLVRRVGAEAWVVLALFTGLLLLFDAGYQRAASDGRIYFAQLHSIFFDHDLRFANDVAAFGGTWSGKAFPMGTPILWLPFYAAAHLWLGLLDLLGAGVVRDGFSNPYQRAVGIGTFVYGMFAVTIIATLARRWFDRSIALVATVVITLATPVVWYVAVDASMSHGVSLFSATLFLALWIVTREGRTRVQWAWLLASAVLMIVVRPPNALFLVVLAVELGDEVLRSWRAGDRDRTGRLLARAAAGVVAGAVAVGLLLAAGGVAPAYLLQERLLTQWVVGLQLFSPDHGLLSSSPVLVFACLGLLLLARRDAVLATGLTVAVLLHVLVGGTSDGWNAGASFGARRFVACALPFTLGLGACVQSARRRPMVPIALGLIALVALNLAVVDDARRQALSLSDAVSFDRMVGALTWRIGNPFALPGALLFAWEHRIPLGMYDRIPGRKYSTLRIDVGARGDELYLIGAWFSPELAADGPFRWASRPEVGIFTQVRESRYRLRFEAEPFTWPDAPPQRVEIWLGRERLAELELRSGLRSYEVTIPADRMPADDWMRIAFRFDHAVAPSVVLDAQDDRALAARFRSITLEPY